MAMKVVIVTALFVVLVVTMMSPRVEGLTCGQVTISVAPCITYVKGAALSFGCCPGVRKLNRLAQTPDDRKTACKCLKSIGSRINGINHNLTAGLPKKCGVSIPYKFSPSTDCAKIN